MCALSINVLSNSRVRVLGEPQISFITLWYPISRLQARSVLAIRLANHETIIEPEQRAAAFPTLPFSTSTQDQRISPTESGLVILSTGEQASFPENQQVFGAKYDDAVQQEKEQAIHTDIELVVLKATESTTAKDTQPATTTQDTQPVLAVNHAPVLPMETEPQVNALAPPRRPSLATFRKSSIAPTNRNCSHTISRPDQEHENQSRDHQPAAKDAKDIESGQLANRNTILNEHMKGSAPQEVNHGHEHAHIATGPYPVMGIGTGNGKFEQLPQTGQPSIDPRLQSLRQNSYNVPPLARCFALPPQLAQHKSSWLPDMPANSPQLAQNVRQNGLSHDRPQSRGLEMAGSNQPSLPRPEPKSGSLDTTISNQHKSMLQLGQNIDVPNVVASRSDDQDSDTDGVRRGLFDHTPSVSQQFDVRYRIRGGELADVEDARNSQNSITSTSSLLNNSALSAHQASIESSISIDRRQSFSDQASNTSKPRLSLSTIDSALSHQYSEFAAHSSVLTRAAQQNGIGNPSPSVAACTSPSRKRSASSSFEVHGHLRRSPPTHRGHDQPKPAALDNSMIDPALRTMTSETLRSLAPVQAGMEYDEAIPRSPAAIQLSLPKNGQSLSQENRGLAPSSHISIQTQPSAFGYVFEQEIPESQGPGRQNGSSTAQNIAPRKPSITRSNKPHKSPVNTKFPGVNNIQVGGYIDPPSLTTVMLNADFRSRIG